MLNKNIPYIGKNVKTPSSTGKSTLSEYIKELATNKNRFGYIVVSGFSDLPRTDWGFTLELVSVNSLYVKIHRSLSNGEYYIRGMSYDYQWVGDWQKILTNSDLYHVTRVIGGYLADTLRGKTDKVTLISFVDPPDCPFSFKTGYCIAFNSLLITNNKTFTLIGTNGTNIETKILTIT